MAAAGPASDCFFVGRAELLAWVNGLLGTNVTKVEAVRIVTWAQGPLRTLLCICAPLSAASVSTHPRHAHALQLASGAAHCQIIDAIHPGAVALHKARVACLTRPPSIPPPRVWVPKWPFAHARARGCTRRACR